MAFLLTTLLLLPLIVAAIIALGFNDKHRISSFLGTAGSIATGVLTVLLFLRYGGEPVLVNITWLTAGEMNIAMGFYLNDLALLLLSIVSLVGLAVHVFSLGYMAKEPGRSRYFAALSLFMFSMIGIVVASNLIMLFVFCEPVGLSSYLLINHFFDRPSAAAASKKAFIVNRIGDFGFLIGIVACWHVFGTVDLVALREEAVGTEVMTFIGLCLFCGVIGKSAQLPLHVWLPDAMEGPTPISALIHAATMVAAGVYLLCRIFFLFSIDALGMIAWVGAATAIYAAVCALGQKDIKRVLAYSTLSQLGFMVAGFGVGTAAGLLVGSEKAIYWGVSAALFHLTTHAFFKALLFLGSGSIIHACHHSQDMDQLGGLWKRMPLTFVTFTIGVIAIAGVPFVAAGFFSKDILLFISWEQHLPIFAVLTVSSLLTVVYMARLWLRVFFGEARSKPAREARESEWRMSLPLIVLAGFSILGGWEVLYPKTLSSIWNNLPHPHGSDATIMIGLSGLLVLIGFALAWHYYRPQRSDALEVSRPKVFSSLQGGLFFDGFYGRLVRLQQPLVEGWDFIDRVIFAGLLMHGSAGLVGMFGVASRDTYTGKVQSYLYWFLGGVIVLTIYVWMGQ